MALGRKRKAADRLSKQPLDLPSGTIIPFAGTVAPEGWAICDGSLVNRTTYSSLYAAIGDAWGNGDGSVTFHLPDMRGKFMRGTDNAAGNDPDAAGRTAGNAGGNTGDAVGSVQSDEFGSHDHDGYSNLNLLYAGGGGRANDAPNGRATGGRYWSTLDTGGNETRPINANVNYMIKL